jgi:hypothetical protein
MQKIIQKLEYDLSLVYRNIDDTEHSIVVALEDNKMREEHLVKYHLEARDLEKALDMLSGNTLTQPQEQDARQE